MTETQCVFVNTEQPPKKIKRLGFFKVETKSFGSNEKIVSEMCEVFYPHPDAPEDALVSVYRFIQCKVPHGLSSSVEFVAEAMKGFQDTIELSEFYKGIKTE